VEAAARQFGKTAGLLRYARKEGEEVQNTEKTYENHSLGNTHHIFMSRFLFYDKK